MSGSSNVGNYTSPNLVLPYQVPSDVPKDMVPLFKPLYLAFQNIVQTLVNYCGIASRSPSAILSSNNDPSALLANNMHRFYCQAAEAILPGAAVNLTSIGGNLMVQNANATDGTKPCDGFCLSPLGVPNGNIGEFILNDGMNQNLSGLTVGGRYYLSTTAGGYTLIPPTAAGNLQQYLGVAVTTTALRFWTGPVIQH